MQLLIKGDRIGPAVLPADDLQTDCRARPMITLPTPDPCRETALQRAPLPAADRTPAYIMLP